MTVPEFLSSHPIACESSQPTPGAQSPLHCANRSAADARRGSDTGGDDLRSKYTPRSMSASSELLQRRMNLSTHLVNPTPSTSVFPTPQPSYRPTPAASPAKPPAVAATRPSRNVCRKLTSLYEYSGEDVALTDVSRQRSPSPGETAAPPSEPRSDTLLSNELYSPCSIDESYQLRLGGPVNGSDEAARHRKEEETPSSATSDRGLGYWTERAEFWRQRADQNVKTSQQFVPGSLAGLLSMPITGSAADVQQQKIRTDAKPLSQSMDTELYRQMATRPSVASGNTENQQTCNVIDCYVQQSNNGSALSTARAHLRAAEVSSSEHTPASSGRAAATAPVQQTPRLDSKRLHDVVLSVKQMKESLRQSQECGDVMNAEYCEQLDSQLAELEECLATFRAMETPVSDSAHVKFPTKDVTTSATSTIPVSPVYNGPVTPEMLLEQGPAYHSPETKQALKTSKVVEQPPLNPPQRVAEPQPRQPGCFGCLFSRS